MLCRCVLSVFFFSSLCIKKKKSRFFFFYTPSCRALNFSYFVLVLLRNLVRVERHCWFCTHTFFVCQFFFLSLSKFPSYFYTT